MPKSTATPTGDIDLIVIGRSTGLSRLILQVAKARQLTVRQLPFERIATHARIEDCLATGGTNIRWEFDHPDGPGIISPENVRGVFCYGDIPRHMRTDVVKEDIDYVHHEIVAYLGFALSQFASVINKPFSGSLTGYTDTLPYQWNILTLQGVAGVRVPKYDITTRLVPRDGMVYSTDFHSYTEWNSASLPPPTSASRRPIYLRYERPAGDPCLIWFVDSFVIAVDPTTGHELMLNTHEQRQVSDLIGLFCDCFQLRMGQILLFRHGPEFRELTFGSVAPWISFPQATPSLRRRFASSLLDGLLQP